MFFTITQKVLLWGAWNCDSRLQTLKVPHGQIFIKIWDMRVSGGGLICRGMPQWSVHSAMTTCIVYSYPGYMSRQIRKFWTDKVDTSYKRIFWLKQLIKTSGNQPFTWVTRVNFRLLHVSNLSVQNFRIFLLIIRGSDDTAQDTATPLCHPDCPHFWSLTDPTRPTLPFNPFVYVSVIVSGIYRLSSLCLCMSVLDPSTESVNACWRHHKRDQTLLTPHFHLATS